MIPNANPKAGVEALRTEIDAVVARVLDSGWYILGSEVREFETEFAAYCGTEHCIGVGNGTDALHLALRACGIGPGDEVITVSLTAVATVAAVELSGATAIMADIDPATFCIDPVRVRKAITERTKAIIPVHLYGHPADMDAILAVAEEYSLTVIEDCAQAHGALLDGRRTGSMGHLACFSFYPTKNLGALGDGGAVVTSDTLLADKLRLIREYGWEERYISSIAGMNTRLDEMQAAILRIKLARLDQANRARQAIATIYEDGLSGIEGLVLPSVRHSAEHVHHLYVLRSKQRDVLLRHLHDNGIGAAIHYPAAVHQQPAYSATQPMGETEKAVSEILSLPMYPELGEENAFKVVEAVRGFYA